MEKLDEVTNKPNLDPNAEEFIPKPEVKVDATKVEDMQKELNTLKLDYIKQTNVNRQ